MPQSAAFDQRVAPGSSSPRAALALVAVTVAVVGAAVAKPWGGDTEPLRQTPETPARTPTALATPAPRIALSDRLPGTVELPPWSAVADAVVPHAEWGVRAIVDNRVPPNPGGVEGRGADPLAELWRAGSGTDGPGRSAADPVVIESPTPIRLLGLTIPDGVRPNRIDVRVVTAMGRTLPVRFVRLAWFRQEEPLLVPAGRNGGFVLWTPGTYQLVATAGNDVTRLTVRIVDPTTASAVETRRRA